MTRAAAFGGPSSAPEFRSVSSSIWPPDGSKPSPEYRGEASKRAIFEAVGSALHDWEKMEWAISGVFAWLCEARSPAARRAYGTIISVPAKRDAINVAAVQFFHNRRLPDEAPAVDKARLEGDHARIKKLVKTYVAASEYRNNVAHGMAWEADVRVEGEPEPGPAENPAGNPGEKHDWYLCAPPQATKHLEPPDRGLSRYYYRAAEINRCGHNFITISNEAQNCLLLLCRRYPFG